ncbi:Gfo/Idh/MocA family oxidoreductase [Puniceicoccaceae bacterium K14]|nr:Gfo/Idh/MocA family oxidoreductase [Puniceicoccaceae bacterium K14]
MKFGIIGTGTIADIHAHAIKAIAGCEIVGVFSRSKEKANTFAEEHGTVAYDSLNELLGIDNLDIVTVATPSGAHLDPTLAAIEAGKHVLVEKPLEITTERIDQMIVAAKEKGVLLAAILNRRFHPAMAHFKEATNAGRFGKLTSASMYMKWYRDQNYYDSGAWRGTWKLDGGGAIMNQGIHSIDALLHLAGPVKSLQANTACLAHDGIEVEDIAVIILEFVSGARGVIEASTCTWSKDGHPARIQLSGTDGSAFLADESFEVWEFANETSKDGEIREQYGKKNGKALGANDPKAINFSQHQRNFEEAIAAIKEKREPNPSATEARRSVELIQAIYKSTSNDGAKIFLT